MSDEELIAWAWAKWRETKGTSAESGARLVAQSVILAFARISKSRRDIEDARDELRRAMAYVASEKAKEPKP